jgi:hemolysin III
MSSREGTAPSTMPAEAPPRPGSEAERIADGVVHGIGLALAAGGTSTLMVLSSRSANWSTIATAAVYVTSLMAVLTISALYNMWPASPTKSLLRRFDQAAIYLLIGGTYTAFLTRSADYHISLLALGSVWAVVIVGTVTKLALPGRFERLSLIAYLGLGWSGLVLFPTAIAILPPAALYLIALGGLLYSAGVIFFLWERLRFQTAIWHALVLVAAICHYGAVVDCLVIAPA